MSGEDRNGPDGPAAATATAGSSGDGAAAAAGTDAGSGGSRPGEEDTATTGEGQGTGPAAEAAGSDAGAAADDATAQDHGAGEDGGAEKPDPHAALAALEEARAAEGDPARTIRALRRLPEGFVMADEGIFEEVAGLVARAARTAGLQDLAQAAEGARDQPKDPHALYGYGYSCVERGVAFLAVPALALALRHAPGAGTVRMELVSALEAEARHADAVQVLAGSDALDHWTGRYLLVFNCLMSGDIDGARQWYSRLGPPEEEQHQAMAARLTTMLSRVQLVTGATSLDDVHGTPADPRAPLGAADLRGWHFALNGGLLTTLSPYGADTGMTGRYAYLAETYSSCRWALHRLVVALEAAGRRPASVALLPERSSRILGLAAAELLGVPARDWSPQAERALAVAYSLSDMKPRVLAGLRTAPHQVLLEHATCWTEPPAVAADVSTLLHQVVVPPWGARRVAAPDGEGWVEEPADDRPEREIAAELVAAAAVPDPGDGTAPPDPDDALAEFAARIAPMWAPPGVPRDRVWSPGPVRSARFW